jgi:hypothetical protein
MSRQSHCPAALPPAIEVLVLWYLQTRWLSGFQSRCGRFGFEPRIVQLVVYRVRYCVFPILKFPYAKVQVNVSIFLIKQKVMKRYEGVEV